ncbi:MAG: TerD family protein [Candidatus Sericytochromatia bacterium]|nr:TerD family protein [Candidatus Sericytochromatia bacterium]
MAINLRKGEKMDIGLSQLKIGLGWDPNPGTGQSFDLDVSVFMLNAQKLLPVEDNFIFYNHPLSPDKAVHYLGDDRSGGSSDGDDEMVEIDLNRVDAQIAELLFVVTIYDYEPRRQNFGQVRNSYIRLLDVAQQDQEIARYDLDEDFSIESAVEFGRIYRRGGLWRFEASGIGYRQDLGFFIDKYSHFQVNR